ncbi:PVC-type heme-binding CxxCH protein [Planctomycetaceae bacterium SH139]
MLLRITICLLSVATYLSGALPAEDDAWQTKWGYQQVIDRFYSEGVATGDINGDGHQDIVAGPFWFAGPDFTARQQIEAGQPVDPHGYAPHFFSFTDDLDGDGRLDILHIGFPGAASYWLQQPADATEPWLRHEVLAETDNESPTYADITGDGNRELICSTGGSFGYAKPIPGKPTEPWSFHAISPQGPAGGRFTHGLGIGDVNGDGRQDLLEKNGWWEQPESLTGDPIWKHHPFQFSAAGGSQMFAHDFDGDGDNDIVTALQAHGYGVVWYEQIRNGEHIAFKPHTIVGAKPADSAFGVVFSQPHAVTIADLDGDGLMDIITGKRPWAHGPHGDVEPLAAPVIYWFRCQREAEGETRFVPHLISDKSGVGVDVLVSDVNADGWLDVVACNKRGIFVHRQDRTTVDAQLAARLQPVSAEQAARPLPAARRPSSGLEPAAAARQFTVPAGFSVDLVAGEPDLHQPIAFAFDSRGRIWVAEAHTYPNRAAAGQGKDVIRIFEDTNGDGRYDSKKTFIEGLNLVSGLEVGFGGVWVGAAPNLLFIPDADGDDQPDSEPQVLLDGFGYQDTHETLNAFRWGPDGWLYGCQGVFTHSQIGVPGSDAADRTAMNAGVWRYHPVRHRFEVFAHGTSNPWGVTFDQHGQAFITACVIPHAYHMIQGGRYQRQAGQHFDPYTFEDIKTIADHAHYAGNIGDHAWWGRNEPVEDDATSAAGGGHAHCGALIYQGDNWPVSYRGALLMHNLHGNRMNVDLLRADGTGFIASHGRDVMFANDPWFRGLEIQSGPDGAVYLIDWYDKNACHRTTPEIWDRTNGRMYRVRFGELAKRNVNLAEANDEALLALLEHPNAWHYETARRVLMERAAAGIPLEAVREKLLAAIKQSSDTAQRLRYLWTAHGISAVTTEEAIELLDDNDPLLRAWTIQLACETDNPTPALLSKLAELARQDREPVVQLYLASALQRIGNLTAPSEIIAAPLAAAKWTIAEGLISNGDSQFDRNLPLLIWYAINPLVAEDPQRGFALARATRIPKIKQFIYRRAASDPTMVNALVAAMAEEGDLNVVKMMLAELAGTAAKLGKIDSPPAWPQVVAKSLKIDDPNTRRAVQMLSVNFGDASVFPLLRETVNDRQANATLRQEALATLARGADPQLETLAMQLLDDPTLIAEALPLLARFDSPKIPQAILRRYAELPAPLRRTALDTLSSRPAHAAALLDAVADERLPRTELTAVHAGKIRQLGNQQLQQRLTELWGVVGSTPEEIEKEIATMVSRYTPQVITEGNASHGRLIYNKSCGQCHKLFGTGSDIGPDLTGANRAKLEYLLENILAPNAIVGKDYQALSLLTLDGRVITGLVREETDAAIVLHDAEKLVTVPRSEIEEVTQTSRSVMPEGILKPMSETEIVDLLKYLQSSAQVPLAGDIPDIDRATGKLPGALEAEQIETAKVSGGSLSNQGMAGFKAGRWSGNGQIWWNGGSPGDTLSLPFQIDQADEYTLFTALTKARDYAVVRIAVDDQVLIDGLDLFENGRVVTTGPLELGKVALSPGGHKLTVTILGANPQAVPAHMVGVDYLYWQGASSKDQ